MQLIYDTLFAHESSHEEYRLNKREGSTYLFTYDLYFFTKLVPTAMSAPNWRHYALLLQLPPL